MVRCSTFTFTLLLLVLFGFLLVLFDLDTVARGPQFIHVDFRGRVAGSVAEKVASNRAHALLQGDVGQRPDVV